MEAVVITPESSTPAAGPYSPALKVGEWVFLSGQGGFDPRSGQHYRAADRTKHSQCRRGTRRRRWHPARCRLLSHTSERLVALCIIQRHISEAFSGGQTGTNDGGSVSGARDAGGNYSRRSGCEKRVRAIALSTMDLGLAGKKALISGSTAGIGFAIASRLAAEQSEVIISGRTEQRVDRAIQEIKRQVPGARVSEIPGDLSRPEVALAVTDRFPDLDIVVNNLGIFEVRPFPEISDEEWERVLQTNLFSGIRLGRYYLPRMLSRNQGRIIFISSESALNIPQQMIHYGVTKTAQAALARGMAELTVGSKVTVNTILAGPTLSEGAESSRVSPCAPPKTFAGVRLDFFLPPNPATKHSPPSTRGTEARPRT